MGKRERTTLRKKCSNLEFFWSAFSCIWTEYGEILCISPYSVQMRENTVQRNSENEHFSRTAKDSTLLIQILGRLVRKSCQQFCSYGKIIKSVGNFFIVSNRHHSNKVGIVWLWQIWRYFVKH